MKKEYTIKDTFKIIFLMLVVVLMILPLSASFNELLTSIVEDSAAYKPIQQTFVPYMSRLMYGVLKYLPGIEVSTFPYGIVVNGIDVRVTWNCLGWQSFLLFFTSCLIGLRGNFKKTSKEEAFLFGFLGIFLMNMFRLVFTAALVGWWRGLFVILFHNYFSSFLTIAWLFFFWWFSYAYVLEENESGLEITSSS